MGQKLSVEVFDSPTWQRWAGLLCAAFLLGLAIVATFPVLKDPEAVFAFNDGNIETVLSPIYEYPSSLFRIWDNQFFFGRGESFGVSVTEWSLLETILGPHQYRRLGVLLALWLTGLAGFWSCRQFGRSRGAALVGGVLLLLCGWTATFPAVGLLGRAFSLGWAALSLGFLERARRQSERAISWWAIALGGGCLGFAVENTPDVGAFLALACAAFLVLTRLPWPMLPWRPRPWLRLACLLGLYVAASFATAWPTVVKMKASNLLGAEAAAVSQDGDRFDWATQWSLPKTETWSLFAGNFHGTYSRNPDAPYWGAVGQSPGWLETQQGYPNFKLAAYTVGCTSLILLLFLWTQLPRHHWLSAGRPSSGQLSVDPPATDPTDFPARRLAWVSSLLLVISLVLAWGRFFPLYRLVFLVPTLTAIRNPEKWLGPFTLFLALAVSLAVDVARHRVSSSKGRISGTKWLWITGWSLAGFAFVVAEWFDAAKIHQTLQQLRFPSGEDLARAMAEKATLQAVLVSLAIAIGLQLLVNTRGLSASIRGRAIVLLLLGAMSFELLWSAQPFMRQHHYGHILQPNPLTDTLDSAQGHGRLKLLPARHPILNQWRLTYLISRGYDLFDPISVSRLPEGDRQLFETFGRNEIDLWRWGGVRFFLCSRQAADQLLALSGPGQRFVLRASRPAHEWAPFSNTSAAQQVLHQQEISLVEFLDAQPMVRLEETWVSVPDTRAEDQKTLTSLLTRASRGSGPSSPNLPVRVHGKAPPPPPTTASQSAASTSRIEWLEHSPIATKLQVETELPSLLVRATRHHPGWRASINGKPAQLLRVDHSFQGIWVPAGNHVVTLTFDQPRWVLFGGLFSRLLFLVGVLLYFRRSSGAREDRGPHSKILIMALSGAGDVLLLTPMLRRLRQQMPQAHIEVLVMQGPAARDALAGNPFIDRVTLHNFMAEPKADSLRLLWKLRREAFDLLLLPMPHNRLVYNAMAAVIGGRRRLGFHYRVRCGSMERWFLHETVEEDNQLHLSENNLRLLTDGLGLPVVIAPRAPELFLTEEQMAAARASLGALNLGPGTGTSTVILGGHPGSGGTKNLAEKRWPEKQWIRFARDISEREDCHLLLFGGPEEEGLRERIAAEARGGNSRVIAMPTTSLMETAALISLLDTMVSCDTLLTHVGVAVGTPSVALFGPTPIAPVRPLEVHHEIVSLGLGCSPCYGYGRYGIRCSNRKRFSCMGEISPQSTLEAVDRALSLGKVPWQDEKQPHDLPKPGAPEEPLRSSS